MVVLETERLFMRQWVPEDWQRFKPLATDSRVLKYISTSEPSSDERIQQFVNRGIETAKTRGWTLWPVIRREDSVLIGFCGFWDGFPPTWKSAGDCCPSVGGRAWRPKRRR